MLIYLLIFISKIIENALSTLRLIIVSNGKKKLGAILQGIIGIIWIFATSIVIKDISKDPFKIIIFCIGSVVGSYLGSILEGKLAIGTNMIICILNQKYEQDIKNILNNYYIISLCEKDKDKSILFITAERKQINKIIKIIKNIDKNSILIKEKVKFISNIV